MRISTEIASIARQVGGEENAIRMVARAGFDAYDLSLFEMAKYDYATKDVAVTDHPYTKENWREYVRHLRRVADEEGIVCNQSHAPFPVASPGIRARLKDAIEATAIAGGNICVIHPNNYLSAEENAEMFRELLPTAHAFGVKIATENMWCWDKERDEACVAACSHHEDFVRHIDVVDDPCLVACLDIGHAEMRGLGTSARAAILALGERLQAVHLHDNDRWHDSHELPFTMQIDFADVVNALREAGYQGDVTLEADRYLQNHPERAPSLCVEDMAKAAQRLRSMLLGENA